MKVLIPKSLSRYFTLLLLLLISVFTGCATPAIRESASSNDFHVGIWLNRTIMKEGEQSIITFLDDAAARGITAIYPNFWFHGYAIYPGSQYVEQHPAFTGWNPLEVVLREANKRGLAVHPWGEYGFFTHYNFTDSQEDVGYILEQNLEWIAENREGRISLYNPEHNFSHYSLNPAHPQARLFLRNVMLEVMRLHPEAAGLNLDRIRYQGSDFSYDRFSLEAFKTEQGFDPLQIGPDPQKRSVWDRWRVEQIKLFMREMTEAFQAEFPGKTLSAAVIPPYMMDDKFQRWDEAVAEKTLQIPIPMIYGSLALARREIDRSFALLPEGSTVYVGLDVASMDSSELLLATAHARSRGAAGIVLWDDEEFRRKIELSFTNHTSASDG